MAIDTHLHEIRVAAENRLRLSWDVIIAWCKTTFAPPLQSEAPANEIAAYLARIPSNRYGSLTAAIAINLAAVWFLASSVNPEWRTDTANELHVSLFPNLEPISVPPPQFVTPTISLVPAPVIQIEPDTAPPTAITAASMALILPPRPDVRHINAPPDLPAEFKKLGSTVSVVLKIFVQPDGSISDAHVMKTSGDSTLDDIAAAYVKSNWRYVPASLSGQAVEDWTTVFVPFKG